MSKRTYYILWFGLLFCMTIFRANAQQNVLEMDASTSCGLYTARDRVVMKPGYSTNATGYSNPCITQIVRIDEDLIEPSSPDNYSQTQFDPSSISINTNLPVQNNEGSAAVGKDGSANYTVNIALPPGINDLIPSLSIAYNSNSGSGFFGLGWSLTGLSAISRIPKNMYENGTMEAINLNSDDLYALDGNRLVSLTGTYGADNTIYSTKIEQNSRIISHGSNNGPEWFEVQTPTGSTIEYGKNPDARQSPLGNTNVLTWYISQIRDINGNYINFKYRTYQGETILDYIEYTGNTDANVNPMNKIKFYYVEKIDKSFSYVGGYKLTSNVLCDKIRIFNNEQCVNEYSFVYYFDNDNYKSKLIEVKYKINDVTEVNSTKIIWHKYDDFNEVQSDFFELPYMSYENMSDVLKCVGDFNGDGVDELFLLLELPIPNTQLYQTTTWQMLIIENGVWHIVNSGSLAGLIYNPNHGSPLQVFDFDGDGKDDLIFRKYVDESTAQYVAYSFTGNSVVGPNVLFNISEGGTSTNDILMSLVGYHNMRPNTNRTTMMNLVDFDGDGKNDIIGLKATQNGLITKILLSKLGANNQFISLNAERIDYGDFNGNGKAELWAFYVDRIEFYEIIQVGFAKIYTLNFWFQSGTFLGDFNGDGKTDIAQPNEGNDWVICYSTGSPSMGFYTVNAPFSIPITTKCIAIDFDADGITDVAESFGGNMINYGYNTRLFLMNKDNTCRIKEFIQSPIRSISYKRFGDFNGDGLIDIAQGDNSLLGILFRVNDDSRLVKEICDGFLKVSEFGFSPITNNNIYNKNISTASNIINIQSSNYVVKYFDEYASNIQVIARHYKYEDLEYHIPSRSYLGFSKIIEFNSLNQTYSLTKNDFPYYTDLGGNIVTPYYKGLLPIYSESGTFQTSSQGYSFSKKTETTYDNYILNNYGYLQNAGPGTYTANNYREMAYLNVSTSKNYVDNTGKITEYWLSGTQDKIPSGISTFGTYLRLEISNVSTYSSSNCSGNPVSKTTVVNGYNDAPFCSWHATQLAKTTSLTTSPSDAQMAANKRTKTFEYYTNATNGAKPGFIKKQILDPDHVDMSIVTEYVTYDAFGHPTYTKQYDAQNNLDIIESHVQFDNNGQFVIKKINPLNQITTFEYNAVGQLLKSKDINGLYTNYEYDDLNHLEKTLNPDGTFIKTEYEWESSDPGALFKKTTTSSGNPPSIEYFDCLSRSLKTQGFDINNNQIITSVVYNPKGQVQSKSLPYKLGDAPLNITYTYDDLGRNTITNMPDGSSLENIYDEKMLTKKVTKNGVSQQQITKVDALGQVVQNIDNNGINVYSEYNNAGLVVKTWVKSGTSAPTNSDPHTEFVYDLHGNKLQLTDLDAGTINYSYDAYGRQTGKTDANNITTSYVYDKLGRMLTQSNADGTTTWEYDTKPFGKGLLSKVTYNNTMQEYWHDNLSRLTKTVETVDARTFEENYTYDAYSRLEKQIYPDNFTIIHSYLNGQLYEVKNFANNESIWKAQSQDVYGNYDKYLSGNSLLTEITRDNTNGHITDIKSGQNNPIQWWHYTYDDNNNLESRSDYVSGQNEYFTYDSDNRLTNVGYNTDINHTLLPLLIMDYDFRGNITTKSDAGGYLYEDPNKPNQLSKLTNYNPASTPEHFLQYFINGKTKKIEQGNQIIDFTYGADAMRVKTIFNDNGIIHTKYFALGDYEEEVVNGVAAKYYYIAGGDGLAAIYKQVGTAAGTMYYVHKDLLGSIDLLTTKVNGVVQVAERYAYDAWGNRRAPANWTLPDTRTAWIIVRGYIGQEHLNILGLINLNGRIFEPRTARFLSADDFVSAPDFSQAYNRYAYCVNNPLRYTDPNGEFWNLVIGALVGGVMNWAMNGAEFTWRGLGYFGIGTVSGSLGAGIGGGISSMIMGSSFGAGFIGSSLAMAAPSCFLTGAAIGGSAGLAGSFVNGFGNGLMGGQSFGNALVSSLQSGIIGGVSGAILAGIVGGIRAESKGMSFWTGGEKPKVYYSPVEDNIGRADAQCALRCLEECSESYGMKQYDYEKWLGLNGGNSAVDANSLESLIDGTKIFSSDPVTPDPQEIANAFSSDKRVILAITTEKGSAHAVMVSKVKIWPSGKYSVWFAETSPVRYTPYSTSDFFELNGPRFWSFYLSK